MGSGASTVGPKNDQINQSQRIDADIQKQKTLAAKSVKVLLLGPGDSGKSTVLKQMRLLHTNGFSSVEIEAQSLVVRENLIMSMVMLLQAMEWLEIPLRDANLQTDVKMLEAVSAEKRNFHSLESFNLFGPIKRLWQDEGVQECFKRQNEFQLMDSAKYFLDDIDRIGRSGYKATTEDLLRSRSKSFGITELQFELRNLFFRVVDVGGQRSQRRKWIKCFDGVETILFVASISEYNQRLEEESEVNRMVESLSLFESVANTHIFVKTPVILFLNKIDLFDEKISIFPLSIAFPSYTGQHTPSECKEKIKREYLKGLHTH